MKDKIKAKLDAVGIKSLTDIDLYAKSHKVNGEIPSRYDVLCQLLGQNTAIAMLHELSIQQCCKVPRK